jgi:hypothetical protein
MTLTATFNLQLARIQAAGFAREVAYTLSRAPFYSAAQARGFLREGGKSTERAMKCQVHRSNRVTPRTEHQIRLKAESNRRQRERKRLLKLQQMALTLQAES